MRLLVILFGLVALPVSAHDSETPFFFINDAAVAESPISFSSVPDWELAEHLAEPVRVGEAVRFSLDASYFKDTEVGLISSATWKFGDETTAEGLQVSHTYQTAGRYLVQVTSGEQILSDTWLQVLAANQELPSVPEVTVNGKAVVNGTAEASFRKTVTLRVTNLPEGATVSWDLGNTQRAEGMLARATYDPLMSTAYPIVRITKDGAVREVQLILEYPGAGQQPAASNHAWWVSAGAGALLLVGAWLLWRSRQPMRY